MNDPTSLSDKKKKTKNQGGVITSCRWGVKIAKITRCHPETCQPGGGPGNAEPFRWCVRTTERPVNINTHRAERDRGKVSIKKISPGAALGGPVVGARVATLNRKFAVTSAGFLGG